MKNSILPLSNKTVFQVFPSKNIITLNDIKEVRLATRNMSKKDRMEIYCAHNVHYENVRKYHKIVKTLNKQFEKKTRFIDFLERLLKIIN